MKPIAALLLLIPGVAHAQFAWREIGGGKMELREWGRPVLVYNYGPQQCCYVYPLYTATGVSLLADSPPGEPHHHGLYWAWPAIEANGKTYDSWQTLTARDRSIGKPVTKGATLESRGVWEADGKDIVRELVRLTILPAGEMEFVLTFEAIDGPVRLAGATDPGKSYGGFNAHLAPRDATVLRADTGILADDEDLVTRPWAEIEGVYEGKRAVLRITPEDSHTYQWCLRHRGFLGASFPGHAGYTLERGHPLVLRFRVEIR